MRRITMLACALFALLALPLAARAGCGEPGPGGPHGDRGYGPEGRLEKNLEELGLTDAQLAKVRGVIAGAREQREAQRETLRAEFEAMHTLLEADAPDEAAVMRQAEKIGALKTDAHKRMLHSLIAVRAELTPEQRAKLAEKMRKHGHRRGFGGGYMHGGPHGMGGPPPQGPPPEGAPPEE